MEQEKSLLRFIAQEVLLEHDIKDLYKLSFIFPSRRAGVFFLRELSLLVEDRPFFAPRIETVDSFISQQSAFQATDSLSLLFELYLAYSELLQDQAQSFADFAYWGQMILKDFDDIDRSLIDAEEIFSNVADLKELGADHSYLSSTQVDAIRSFWKDFEPYDKDSEKHGRSEFLSFYRSLAPLYRLFRQRLQERGQAYKGMIYREVSELEDFAIRLSNSSQYYICGLFYLSPSEMRIFRRMQKSGKLTFFWDQSGEVAQDMGQEAYEILRINKEKLGGIVYRGNPKRKPHITVLSVPSFNAQAKALPQLLEIAGINPQEEPDAVIVPMEERLLTPLFAAVPESFDRLNVTMGYPLSLTSASTCLMLWCDLQAYLYQSGVNSSRETIWPYDKLVNLLSNPLIINEPSIKDSGIAKKIGESRLYYIGSDFIPSDIPFLNLLLHPVSSTGDFLERAIALLDHSLSSLLFSREEDAGMHKAESIEAEYLITLKRIVINLQNLCLRIGDTIDLHTAIDLLSGQIRETTFSFEGEPLVGLQVMGQLETRCLAFDKQIILGATDNNLPGSSIASTLIPYTIRRGYGLPHGNVEQATFSYHFFRLIATAKEVLLVYDSRSAGGKAAGEESRYIKQLSYIYDYPIRRINLDIPGDLPTTRPIVVEKDSRVQSLLSEYFSSTAEQCQSEGRLPALSPSRISQYLLCPLSFYFEVVEQIRLHDEPNKTIEPNDFGSILHLSMERIYDHLTSDRMKSPDPQLHPIKASAIEYLLDKRNTDTSVMHFVEEAHAEYYNTQVSKLRGMSVVTVDLISQYVRSILQHDIQLIEQAAEKQLYYIGSEKKVTGQVPIELKGDWEGGVGKTVHIRIKGTIDRLDMIDGTIRVVDYKSGPVELTAKADDLYYTVDPKKGYEQKAIDQTLFYSELLTQNPSLFPGLVDYPIWPTLYHVQSIGKKEKDEKADGILRIRQCSSAELKDKKIKAQAELLPINNYVQQVAVKYRPALCRCLEEIFDADSPFVQRTEADFICAYCPFNSICGR
ncbi:Inactivated superfamily I helicase [Porphyromonas crevioricanis]|uniref:Inactivated superfamily I helicase n=1 Tax=Porphyromonas crevioricanis TaxID=393921 RepID=A0A2X4PII6_9PORP|nr:PD-(D/E)XK nuclease family protein [Porphyromonas crevioricanis]GAD08148.1 hypothetical protein PORCAN_1783 [Porphyromonas crevioricanis JCM 13913]SQH73736.1 Inactivated superfamily I helicase [Porphyromonas crevioricanis]